MFDVIIAGGGPAGLSAALVLGRCLRKVALVDSGRPRNSSSAAVHGFLSRDGIPPHELRKISREQLEKYPSVTVFDDEVIDARKKGEVFTAELASRITLESRKFLLATGVVDLIPPVEGIKELYGKSVFHCPYCDGFELKDRRIAVYGKGESGLSLALKLTLWTDQLVLCSDGEAELSGEQKSALAAMSITLRDERISRLQGSGGSLQKVLFESGPPEKVEALFFTTGSFQISVLADCFDVKLTAKDRVAIGHLCTTDIKGLFAAGDALNEVELAIVAAGQGAKAAVGINKELLEEDLARKGITLP